MIDTYTLEKSKRTNKKFVIIMNGMTHHFGDSRYEDYTTHKDIERKIDILKEHRTNHRVIYILQHFGA